MDKLSRLDWALTLAHKGFLIFPIEPGLKTPYKGVSWKEIMTTDEFIIIGWFNDRPKMNYGVCPGDKFAIVDTDVKNIDGVTRFNDMMHDRDKSEWIDETFSVMSPSGGMHFYLSSPYPVSNAHTFGEGIDVRGAGGYVVGPGCVLTGAGAHDTAGTYDAMTSMNIMASPPFVLEHFGEARDRDEKASEPRFEFDLPASIERAREFLRNHDPAVEGQGGNEHTYTTACIIKDFCISEAKCVELLLEPDGNDDSWNDRCLPPWNATGRDSIEHVVRNVFKYGENQPGDKGGELMESDGVLPPGLDDVGETEQGQAQEADRFSIIRSLAYPGFSFLKRGKRREMIIPEWLPAHGFTALLAKRGMGKTVTMLDVALSLASDRPEWQGQPIQEGWGAIYLCGEDDEGLEEQVRAWAKAYDIEEPADDRLMILDGVVDLMSAEDTKAWSEFLKQHFGERRCVLFVDTWQRATSHAAMNSDEEMQTAVHHAEAMARTLNGPAVLAFHPPKDGREVIIGSSIIENSSTAIWLLTSHIAGKKLKVIRMKGKGESNYRLFRFEEIGLEQEDDFGKERTGIVAVKVGGSEDEASGKNTDTAHKQTTVLAEVIRYYYEKLDTERIENKIDEEVILTPAHVATCIENLPLDGSLRAKLKKGEVHSYKASTVRGYLKEKIVERGIPIVYEDGARLKIVNNTTTGGGKRFVIVQPEIEEEDLEIDIEELTEDV